MHIDSKVKFPYKHRCIVYLRHTEYDYKEVQKIYSQNNNKPKRPN